MSSDARSIASIMSVTGFSACSNINVNAGYCLLMVCFEAANASKTDLSNNSNCEPYRSRNNPELVNNTSRRCWRFSSRGNNSRPLMIPRLFHTGFTPSISKPNAIMAPSSRTASEAHKMIASFSATSFVLNTTLFSSRAFCANCWPISTPN